MNQHYDRAFDAGIAKISGWAEAFVQNLPNIVAALLMLLLFVLVAKLVRRGLRMTLRRFSDHRGMNELIGSLIYVAIVGVGILVALSILKLDDTVTALLAGAGIIGLAVGFAFQETAQNFISGVFLTVRRPFRDGDIVETNDTLGTIVEINMRATELRTFQGQRVIIPNSKVYQNTIVNFSDLGLRRIDIRVGVAYREDLERVRDVAKRAVEDLPMLESTHPVEVFFEKFGDSSIDLVIHFWIRFQRWPDFLAARSEAIVAIKRAFDDADITIPFPIRTLDFAPVGGVTLKQELGGRLGGAGAGP